MPDPFGKAVWNYYKRKDNTPYKLLRDDGFIDKEYPSKYFQTYRQWNSTDKKLIKFAKGKVLDMGAGAGRHSLFFQSKGLSVVAIDISPGAIKTMKARGVKDVRKTDLRKLKFPREKFDTIAFMFNNFGLIGSFSRAKKMLKALAKITSKDAVIIAGIGNPYITNKKEHLSYHKFNRNRGRPPGQVKLSFQYKKEKGKWIYLLLVSPQELRRVTKNTGWKIHKLFNQTHYYYGVVLKKTK